MFFPFGTDRHLARPTLITYLLIALNAGFFVFLAFLGQSDEAKAEGIAQLLALDPNHIQPWAFISYAFVHAGWKHIAGNMLFLWVFGPNVEDRFGRIGFLAFYLAAAAASGGLFAFFDKAPVVGASGAIAGITGAYLVLFPRTNIKTLVFFSSSGSTGSPRSGSSGRASCGTSRSRPWATTPMSRPSPTSAATRRASSSRWSCSG